MTPTPVTVLGATGFVGRHLLARLRADGIACEARHAMTPPCCGVPWAT